MLWIKALHIIFVISWFAGLLYLPRLFVYHATSEDTISIERFKLMEKKLFGIMTVGGIGATVFGVWLLYGYAWQAYTDSVWLHLKLVLVVALIVFHLYCATLIRVFRENRNQRGHVFYRYVNEIPAVIMLAIVILVVVKPF